MCCCIRRSSARKRWRRWRWPTTTRTSSSAAPAAARTSPASPSRSSARNCAAARRSASSRSSRRRARASRAGATPTTSATPGKMTPLAKMHTLGSTFMPPGFHAGGLRYHGMAPLVSHLKELGLIEAVAPHQTACFQAGVFFAQHEGIVPAPEANHAVKGAIDEAIRCKEEGVSTRHPVQSLRPRPLRHAGLHGLLRRQAHRSGLRRARAGDGAGRTAVRAQRDLTTAATARRVTRIGREGPAECGSITPILRKIDSFLTCHWTPPSSRCAPSLILFSTLPGDHDLAHSRTRIG